MIRTDFIEESFGVGVSIYNSLRENARSKLRTNLIEKSISKTWIKTVFEQNFRALLISALESNLNII